MSKKGDHVVEAILFAAGNRIAVARIAELADITEKKALAALEAIQAKYAEIETPFEIVSMDDDWKFTVKREFIPIVEKIAPDTELPRPIVETLAILAWKAPVLQADLIKIRGSSAYDHIGELMDRALISKEKAGRSYTINLTPKFYEYFDIDKGRIKKEMDAFEGTDEVKEEHVKEVMQKEEAERQARLDALEGKPTLDEIRAEEHKDQKDFFDKIEGEIAAVTKRSDEVIGEMQKIVPTQRDDSIKVGDYSDDDEELDSKANAEESSEDEKHSEEEDDEPVLDEAEKESSSESEEIKKEKKE